MAILPALCTALGLLFATIVYADSSENESGNDPIDKRIQQLEETIFLEIRMRQMTQNELRRRLENQEQVVENIMNDKYPNTRSGDFEVILQRVSDLETTMEALHTEFFRLAEQCTVVERGVSNVKKYIQEIKKTNIVLKTEIDLIVGSEEARNKSLSDATRNLDSTMSEINGFFMTRSNATRNISRQIASLSSRFEDQQHSHQTLLDSVSSFEDKLKHLNHSIQKGLVSSKRSVIDYSLYDAIAQTFCTSASNVPAFVYAVRRNCTGVTPTCKNICANLQSEMLRDVNNSRRRFDCFDAIHVAKKRTRLQDNPG
ncbi:hypothetical protein ScPMuIL_009749 [Solemya velum]